MRSVAVRSWHVSDVLFSTRSSQAPPSFGLLGKVVREGSRVAFAVQMVQY